MTEVDTPATACVSIGLPTYNRVDLLSRAIDSVLRQTHSDLELVISDNASTDDTQRVCEEYARRDARIRYIRQPENIGLTGNFNGVLSAAKGEYFLWLADDDWLDDRYIELCLGWLMRRPEYAVVCGVTKFYAGDDYLFDCEVVQVDQDDARKRVLHMYRTFIYGGMFYGVIRRDRLQGGFPGRPIIAEDQYLIAAVLFTGKGATLETTSMNRSREGASATPDSIASHYGVRASGIFHMQYNMGLNAARDVMHNSTYDTLKVLARIAFAVQVFFTAWFRNLWPVVKGRYYKFKEPIRRSFVGNIVRVILRRQ